MSRTILAVDDNQNALALLTDFLSGQGFQLYTAANGREALEVIETTPPDLILLDVMMPTMDGYQFIRRIRRSNNVPIIMLTAKRQEHEVVLGFELGADDYVIKPYRMRELLMRVRAVLRRSQPRDLAENKQTVGTLTINKENNHVTVYGEAVDLTLAEFHLLNFLADSAELPVHRARLCTYLIERGFSGSENTLKIHIRNLRQKIEPDPTQPIYIETIFGIGYRLRAVNS
jgi:DNA-binding response OmpR family regulator